MEDRKNKIFEQLINDQKVQTYLSHSLTTPFPSANF